MIVDGWQESMDKENHRSIYSSYEVFSYICLYIMHWFFYTKMVDNSSFIEKTSSNLHDRLHNFQLLIFLFFFYIVCQHFFFQFLSIDLMAFKLSHQCFYIISFYFCVCIFLSHNILIEICFPCQWCLIYHNYQKYVYLFKVSKQKELKKHVWAYCIIQRIIVLCVFQI